MIALMAPAGFGPSEVRSWSLGTFRAVQDAFNDAYGGANEPKYSAPFPPIEDNRTFKREYGRRT